MDSVVLVKCGHPIPGLNINKFSGVFKSYEDAIRFLDSLDWSEVRYQDDLNNWREAEKRNIIMMSLINLN